MNDLLNTIRQELNALTLLRRRVVKENDTVGRLFKTLKQDNTPAPTWDELRENESRIEALTPGFFIQFSADDNCYVLIPKTDKELSTEQ